MTPARYVMCDQARDKLRDIMRPPTSRGTWLREPSWLALALLVAAFNLLAVTAP